MGKNFSIMENMHILVEHIQQWSARYFAYDTKVVIAKNFEKLFEINEDKTAQNATSFMAKSSIERQTKIVLINIAMDD